LVNNLYSISIKLTKKQKAAYLGIFWFDANLKKIIFVQKKNVDECVDIGGGWISANYDHADYWKTLDKSEIKEMGGIPSNYRSLPRGKVEYDKSSGKFVVFVGDSINDYLLSCIEVEFKLPMANWTYEKNDDYNVSKAT